MKFTLLTTAFALCASVLASPALEERATSCNNANINLIQKNQDSPVAFCYSYLSGSKKTASYNGLKATAVSSACRCITASATACTATKTKTRTVTETAVVTVKKTSTQTKTATFWRTTTTEVRYSTLVKPTTITKTIVSTSIKPTTPTGCKAFTCSKSTIFSTATSTVVSIATSTVSSRCSQTCSVRSCPQSVLTTTTTKAASTVVSLSTITVDKTLYASASDALTSILTLRDVSTVTKVLTPTAQVSTLTLQGDVSTVMVQGDVSTVTQYSTISECSSTASTEPPYPTYSVTNTTTAASSTGSATTSTSDSASSTTSSSASIAPTPTACTTDNLFVNGGFDTGTLGPWVSFDPGFNITSPGYNSANALRISNPGYSTISQTIATIPDAKYNVSFRFYISSNRRSAFSQIWCKTTDVSLSMFAPRSTSVATSDLGTWIAVNEEWTAEESSYTIDCVFFREDGQDSILMIDDLYIGCSP